jgi:hypothetical protein
MAGCASVGSGWALSHVCLPLPSSLPSRRSRSPVAGPGAEHRRGVSSSSVRGGIVKCSSPLLLRVQVGRGLAPPRVRVRVCVGLWSGRLFFPFRHSRRRAQKEKHAHPDAGSACRSAPRSPRCGLWSCVCICAYGAWGGEARFGANGTASGLEGRGGADGSSKGAHVVW